MAAHVLAGDIGGTKTDLALYTIAAGNALTLGRAATFSSGEYTELERVIQDFLGGDGPTIGAASFGIAGPIIDDAVVTTNLPWHVTGPNLRRLLRCEHLRLMNDVEATAYGALFLEPEQLHSLHVGRQRPGTRAIIAAGTGLGQAYLHWDGSRYQPVATEGGHTDFAPRDDTEVDLLHFLQRQYARVSYERILSGPGLHGIFRFLDEQLHRPVAPQVRARLATDDPSAVVGEAGVAGTCGTCVEAVDRFLSMYGAQAGNLVLTVMAVGGLYVGGGIVTKLLPKMTSGGFMQAFTAKGRYAELMGDLPVRVILDPKTALLGAAHAAAELL